MTIKQRLNSVKRNLTVYEFLPDKKKFLSQNYFDFNLILF